MRNALQKALDFAMAKEREAEAFYKEWSQRAKDPSVRGLFAELAGVEYGHLQMLQRISPEDMIGRGSRTVDELGLSEAMVDVEVSEGLGLQGAMILAMKREEAAINLYAHLASWGGQTAPLFEAMVKEERRHKAKLEVEYDRHILTEN